MNRQGLELKSLVTGFVLAALMATTGANAADPKIVEAAKKEGKLVVGGGRAPGEGYFVQPTIIADVDPKSRVAQEEIFGPVLAVIKAKNFDHALEIANGTEFGLTGAVYSKNKAKLEKAEESFHVGNLYLNRKCTGAMVGAHPFGGFNMSGTDSKTGGKDYLHHFLQAKIKLFFALCASFVHLNEIHRGSKAAKQFQSQKPKNSFAPHADYVIMY